MGYKSKKQVNYGAFVACIAAVVLDMVLVYVLKDRAPLCRWLWLPLIGAASASVSIGLLDNYKQRPAVIVWSWLLVIWGVVRGIIVVKSYFQTISGFWAILGAVFMCMFMFGFNGGAYMSFRALYGSNKTVKNASSSVSPRYSKPTPEPSEERTEKPVKKPSPPRQGDLCLYFHSFSCAPQGNNMFFWDHGPFMNSVFGSHSEYTITGTIGVTAKSVEIFHVTSADMHSWLMAKKYEVEQYADEIIRNYRQDYPDDPTDFKINIEIDIAVVS